MQSDTGDRISSISAPTLANSRSGVVGEECGEVAEEEEKSSRELKEIVRFEVSGV